MSSPSRLQAAYRYRLEDKIAAGGYGEVWRATDVMLGRPVAVKRLPAGRAQHAQTLARFRAEAQRAGALCHKNIAQIYDYVEPAPPDPPFLVMELVDGLSLAQVLDRGPLAPAHAMSVIAGAAEGLRAAHEAGLVHRDIKPANLLLTRDGQVKVTDFGISYAVNSVPMTSSNTLLGTSGYVAPERLTGAGVAAPADLYALGIVAWECLTGSQPFSGTPIEVVVAHRDRPLPPLPAAVPADVAALVNELTAKDPAGRPASAGEVASRAAELHNRLATEYATPGLPVAGIVPRPGGAPSVSGEFSTIPSSEVAWLKEALAGSGTRTGSPAGAGATAEPRARPITSGGASQASRPRRGEQGAAPEQPPGESRRPGAGEPWRHAGRAARAGRRAGLPAAAVTAAAVTGLIVAQLTGPGGTGHAAGSRFSRAAAPGVAPGQMIEVSAASLIGQPVGTAASRVRRLGLGVRVIWRPSGRRPPGTVLAVTPAGRVAPHTLVTLTGALAAGERGVSTVPATGPPSGPAGGAGPGTAAGTPAASPPPVSGSGRVSTPSASPSPSSSTGKGKAQGRLVFPG